ncbi:hypothetical protein ACI2T5_25050, partial [Ralstonia nicotianae]
MLEQHAVDQLLDHVALVRVYDLPPKYWTRQNWRKPATLPLKEGVRHEEVEVHGRADCVRAAS